jgi:(2R)-sulfolactate sulfo-lyase subunit alpha
MSQKESVLERGGRRQGQKQIPHVLAHSPKDNVAVVVVEGLKAGTDAFGVVTENDSSFTVDVKEEIPIGHKVALKDFKAGDTVIKYGQDVGKIVAAVKKGMHVHTQNMKTKRW